jgi:antitoxin ParD1/3/4/toxin ParE1/3/4
MKRYLLTRAAKQDVGDIAAYIAEENPVAARRVLAKLRQAMRRLAQAPGLGHLREDLADEPLRFWPVYSYLIVYRSETTPLQVIRVLHGARDVKAILESPPEPK